MLLAGIVFFNVDLLRLNRGIAVNAERSTVVKRENAELRSQIAKLGSSERIQRVAAQNGLVLPAPGEVRYLKANPSTDARNALKRLASGDAASGEPAVATTTTAPADPAASATTTPQATATTDQSQTTTAPSTVAPTTTTEQQATPTTTTPQSTTPPASTVPPTQSQPDAVAGGAAPGQ